MADAPSNTHNKRSLIRTSQVCHRRLAVGRSQLVEEYKHTHNISKLTYQGLNDKNWPVYLPVEIVTQKTTLRSNNSGPCVDHGEINTFQDQTKNAFKKLPINIRSNESNITVPSHTLV